MPLEEDEDEVVALRAAVELQPPRPRVRTDKDPVRVVGCQLAKIVRRPEHLAALQDAVLRAHRATLQATELLNMHVRRLLEAGSPPPPRLFDANWAKQAWVAVSTSRGARACGSAARATWRRWRQTGRRSS
jgi:hypothetical protein